MKNKILFLSITFIIIPLLVSIGTVLAQQDSYTCETCPMMVGSDALEHLVVTDGDGTRHYVECIGCALKLLKEYDTIKIVTYCDWYGPQYVVTADISQNGAVTTVNPSTALTLVGGGCTGNRVAYNQTAVDNLLTNGYSQYTMMMMKQALPANTNTTSIQTRALTFANTSTVTGEGQNYFVLATVAVVGIAVIVAAAVAYKKIKK